MSIQEQPLATDHWEPRLARWSARVHAARLTGVVGALLDAAEPLGPIGAHLLWIAQPTLSVFAPRDEITALARRLEAPGGVDWLRTHLVGPDGEDDDGEQ
jgi:hypothetical protein